MTLIIKIWVVYILSVVQQGTTEPQDITVKHIVQAGENMHSITRSYIGTDILWKENWQLNPHIENPNQLKIGQELTIIKERIIPAEKAKVSKVVNRVEKKPVEGEWLSAVNGDELVQQEGVRTYEKSSALLEFNDESSLKVLEFSQIFLQSRSTGLTGTDSATIEVIKGDAELSWEPLVSKHTEIIIMTGETMLKPQAETGKKAELRTGLTAKGSSVISVYQGNGDVASAGSAVNVKQGMGVAVKPGQAPPEPKPLLQAPVISSQVLGKYNYSNPQLNWSLVDGAAAYLIEICADSICQEVLHQLQVNDTQVQVDGMNQKGQYYFRVAAKSDDELVGFRSNIQPIEFTISTPDINGPLISVELLGAQTHNDNQIIIGPETRINVFAVDERSGLAKINYKWNDQDFHEYEGQSLELPEGNSKLQIQAVDQLGLTTEKSYQFNNKTLQ